MQLHRDVNQTNAGYNFSHRIFFNETIQITKGYNKLKFLHVISQFNTVRSFLIYVAVSITTSTSFQADSYTSGNPARPISKLLTDFPGVLPDVSGG